MLSVDHAASAAGTARCLPGGPSVRKARGVREGRGGRRGIDVVGHSCACWNVEGWRTIRARLRSGNGVTMADEPTDTTGDRLIANAPTAPSFRAGSRCANVPRPLVRGTGRGRAALEPARSVAAGQALVRTAFSGISRGTERLVFERHRRPAANGSACARPMQEGAFPFPVKYGYCATGMVEDGPRGAARPHRLLPASAPGLLHRAGRDAGAGPGRACRRAARRSPPTWKPRSTRFGTAAPAPAIASSSSAPASSACWSRYLAARLPGAEVTVVDVAADRRGIVEALGARFAAARADAPRDADVVFHTSVSAAGLNTAIDCAGMEATIVELSWYGDRDVPARLGGAFHSRRLKLRLVAGRPGLAQPPPALELSPPPRDGAALCSPTPRSTRWSPTRSPSTTRQPHCRACSRPAPPDWRR